MGPPKRGRLFWDRWLQEYYADRVPVTVKVERDRLLAEPDVRIRPDRRRRSTAGGTAVVAGSSGQRDGPRVDAERAARRLQRPEHQLLGFMDTDGYPFVVPVGVTGAGPEGIQLTAAEGVLPAGARRAGLLAHSYRAKLVGLAARQHTGWLEVAEHAGVHALYSPHTEQGFRAPGNKTLLLLGERPAREAGPSPRAARGKVPVRRGILTGLRQVRG